MSDSMLGQNDTSSESAAPASNIEKDSNASLVGYALVAIACALFIRFFIATPFIVSGSSMEHSFENNDYLIVDRISYRFAPPQRGDVVVFGLPQETSRDLIKRIVGLPGETVVLSGREPQVAIINSAHPKGITLQEPYLTPENLGGSSDMRLTLAENEYFVLGDNRRVSADSRVWGVLPRKDIIGRVFVRLFPFNTIHLLPAKATFTF